MPIDAPTYARWEVFASAFGVGVVVLGALCNLIVNQLPSRKLQALCETLDETQSFLGDCVEEGILREGHIRAFQKRLSYLRTRTNEVRSCVHAASTWSEDFSNWAGGYTTMIKRLISDVKKVRYSISTTSREERAKAEAAHCAPDHSDSGSDDTQDDILRIDMATAMLLPPHAAASASSGLPSTAR
ncbi:hypothetical protein NUW54_g3821 [Trametes sanguinea]|uniref:Uncharacterized protein n=1 Tax=Trametes sanguinea TaxID=158606 RepID=A0ACC1Q1K4_9APHY|nr:hypothetical protein NUW54_g3821 [Trametes sanguinea]